MDNPKTPVEYLSPLRTLFRKFLEEKRALGYRYERVEYPLRDLDRFLVHQGVCREELPRAAVEGWVASRPHERPSTQRSRYKLARQVGLFLRRQERPAHVLPLVPRRKTQVGFTARIFTREEMRSILKAADRFPYDARAPRRHILVPEFFRVLYGCGLRVGEAIRLKLRDVDFREGLLRILEGKFRKDRLVPMAPCLADRLQRYVEVMGLHDPDGPLFPAPHRGHYHKTRIYGFFRKLLRAAGIPHLGRGRGPRLHDVRHTFAVHRLEAWYREGGDLNAKLPLLATYLGHRCMTGTQVYLQVTQDLFTDLAERLEQMYGRIIPGRNGS